MVKSEYLEGYRKYAKEYSVHTSNKLIQFQLNHFISLLPKNSKILDAGCGSGRDSAYFADEKLEVTSIDIVAELINEAKNNVKNVNFKLMDMKDIKFDENTFDGIWCMSSISDVEKKDAPMVIGNFNKIIKNNGILYISAREGQGEQVIEKGFFNDLPRFYAYYSQQELEELLVTNKFKVLSACISESNGVKWVEVFAKKE
ncbi:class I SAM-dependent methyltransferase [Candidatus Woesearchaeota archaeon]|nr:class I SAM-dependent methyltransferase [Candidatus Woesearchaeota archaeon]